MQQLGDELVRFQKSCTNRTTLRAGETGGTGPPDCINVNSWGTGGPEKKIQKWALLIDVQLFSLSCVGGHYIFYTQVRNRPETLVSLWALTE